MEGMELHEKEEENGEKQIWKTFRKDPKTKDAISRH